MAAGTENIRFPFSPFLHGRPPARSQAPHDRTPDDARVEALLEHRAEALADLGVSATTLRNAARAWKV